MEQEGWDGVAVRVDETAEDREGKVAAEPARGPQQAMTGQAWQVAELTAPEEAMLSPTWEVEALGKRASWEIGSRFEVEAEVEQECG